LIALQRRQAGRRDPRRILPVRRRQAYAGGGKPFIAANDNAPPASPRRVRSWVLPLAFAAAALLALAFA